MKEQILDLTYDVFYACGPNELVEFANAMWFLAEWKATKEQTENGEVGVSSPTAGHDLPGVLKRTPLYELHKRLGGKLVEFGGQEMPVQYLSIMDEHLAVRKSAGIF